MKYTKKIILILITLLVLLSCSDMPTGTRNRLKLKDRTGRYSVKGNFNKDITLDFIVFESGNINFIGSKADTANNLGTYVLGSPESTNKTFSFDIKETINGVAPNTYFIDFFYGVCVCGIASYSPDGIGGVYYNSALSEHFQCGIYLFFHFICDLIVISCFGNYGVMVR